MNDATYPWFILVPRMRHVEELYQLNESDQLQVLRESSLLSRLLKEVLGADKMNVAALGNVVRQLHIHHVVRYVGDQAWPAPVWGRHAARHYEPSGVESLLEKLKPAIGKEASFEWLYPLL
ncbi:MAG: HIT domain-containing protein [Endozoicomonas sp.]